MLNACRAFPELSRPSDIMRFAHNYSDGIVPDLHRVLFQSIAGTCSHDKNCQNMNFMITL